MTPLRNKDRIFLAVVVPLALLAAYVYCWRIPTAKRVAALVVQHAQLVAVEDFPLEKQKLERQVAEAQQELAAEKAKPAEESSVVGDAAESLSEREQAVLGVFAAAGLRVVGAKGEEPREARGEGVLLKTGLRPLPECRRYELEGSYVDVERALELIARRKLAVLPERLSLIDATRWSLMVWL